MSTPILTECQIAAIGRAYDGTTETIERLLRRFRHLKRHNILNAAKRAGYHTSRHRKTWTPADDEILRAQYGRIPAADLATQLGCSEVALNLRRKRLGFSTRDLEDLCVRDLEELFKVDHRLWQRFFEQGWLRYWEQPRRGGVPVQRVALADLKTFLRAHPEVADWRRLDAATLERLQLEDLPDPPAYMRLTCHSGAFDDRVVQHCAPGPHGTGDRTKFETTFRFALKSCKAEGGTDFWAPTYTAGPQCPRCGSQVSRFSEKAIFSDVDPGEDERLKMLAGKLGLEWNGTCFTGPDGKTLSDEDLLRYVFNTRRNPGDAVRTFQKLLATGMTVVEESPVAPDTLLPSILDYDLREGEQLGAWAEFLALGNITLNWPPGQGKMFFLAMAMSRIAGDHLIFANTSTLLEQWVEHFRTHCTTRITVANHWKPKRTRITLFDEAGNERSRIDLYTYLTRQDFRDHQHCIVGFDEARFLPGNSAHRLALVRCRHRIACEASPYREDGRMELLNMVSGKSVGSDWETFRRAGTIPDVPVRVLVVDDLEDKFSAIEHLVAARKTIVMVERLEDGRRVAGQLAAPFLSSISKNRLATLAAYRTVVASRVADSGIDVRDLQEVIEFGFHRGSRAQSVQRLGRLLHSTVAMRHTVLMTREEFTKYSKRLTALEDKGFKISIAFYRPREGRKVTRPMALAGNRWAQLLGAAAPVLPPAANSRRYVDGRRRRAA